MFGIWDSGLGTRVTFSGESHFRIRDLGFGARESGFGAQAADIAGLFSSLRSIPLFLRKIFPLFSPKIFSPLPP